MKIYAQLHNDYIFTDMIQIPKVCNGKDGMKQIWDNVNSWNYVHLNLQH